jgi:sugar/nucleoside kinase (ribokinase family)
MPDDRTSTRETTRAIDLWVVGSIGIDDIATPREARRDVLGGSVTYACAAASFFARVGAVGIVGSDFPEAFLARYRAFGIDLAGLQRASGPTFRWSGEYEADFINRRTIRTELGVFADFKPELPETFRDAPYVLLGNIGPELQEHVLNQSSGARFVIADTMDLWINIARQALERVIRRVDLLMLNDGEARLLTGRHNLRDCAAAILTQGPRYVVIKKGEHGAHLFSREGLAIIPAYPVDAVNDPTGAGDTFAGGFLGYLARSGRTDEAAIRTALLYGATVASFGVEAFSLERLERLSMAEIEARLAELRGMMTIA